MTLPATNRAHTTSLPSSLRRAPSAHDRHDIQPSVRLAYRKLARAGNVQLAFCWAHVRRRFFEQAAGGTSPVATDALARIAQLYAVEADVRGQSADARRDARQERSRPLID